MIRAAEGLIVALYTFAGFYRANHPPPGYRSTIAVELVLILPTAVLYVFTVPFLHRSIRRWNTLQIASFSLLVMPLTVFGVLALLLFAAKIHGGAAYLIFMGPVAAIWASYRGVEYWHKSQAQRSEQRRGNAPEA